MRFALIRFFGSLFVLGVGAGIICYSQLWNDLDTLNSQYAFQTDDLSDSLKKNRPLRKAGRPFATTQSFAWLDRDQGTGQVQIVIKGDSFSLGGWLYQWILPPGVFSDSTLEASFASPSFNQEITFKIELTGLDPTVNQNLIFQLRPESQGQGGMAVVVPTHFEQTTEAEIAKSFAPSALNPWEKSAAQGNRVPKGIQF
jgi:hypothetical protein